MTIMNEVVKLFTGNFTNNSIVNSGLDFEIGVQILLPVSSFKNIDYSYIVYSIEGTDST